MDEMFESVDVMENSYAGSTMRSQCRCDSATDQSEKRAYYARILRTIMVAESQ